MLRLRLFRHVGVPRNKPNGAKHNRYPCSSIHKTSEKSHATVRNFGKIRPRHWVVTRSAPRMAARESFQAKPTSTQDAVRFYRFQKIGRAGRLEPAARTGSAQPGKDWRERELIGANENANEAK